MTNQELIAAAEREIVEYRRFVRRATRAQALYAISTATDGCPYARAGARLLLAQGAN